MTLAEAERAGRDTITVVEAGEALGISRSAAFDAVKAGQIPAIRVGRRLLVSVNRLRRLIDGE
jgi:excisionase family DNA binding protein